MVRNKKLIAEKDYHYYYIDLIDGATYKVPGYFIADITNKICRLSFDKVDFNERVEVDFETLQ